LFQNLFKNVLRQDTHKGDRDVGYLPSYMTSDEGLLKQIAMIEEGVGSPVAARGGGHEQFKDPNKPGRETIAGKPSDDLAKQAGLKDKK